ncbi:MAG: hypothetical protein H7A46_08555 [Verrucomicrobiales bacterium]|nr:hypothetical protein [Verrucomicrobiales bacterium]
MNETPLEGALGPGQSSERQLTLFLPATVGDWWVFVVTDADDVVEETLENNNTAASAAPVHVAPAYTATVQTDIDVAPAGTVIPLHGNAVRPGGEPAIGELVNIHVVTRGMRRTVSALTDVNGGFTANFQPLPSEGGAYTIGAAHPGVAIAPVQDAFSLLALRLTPDYATQVILPGGVAVSDFELVNGGDRTLTGITAKSGAVDGLDVQIIAPTELAAGASAPVQVVSTVPLPRDAAGRFLVMFESVEGAKAEATIDYLIELPVPRLAATPTFSGGMVRDRQTTVEFSVMNIGGARDRSPEHLPAGDTLAEECHAQPDAFPGARRIDHRDLAPPA